jgi:hypothetical protein
MDKKIEDWSFEKHYIDFKTIEDRDRCLKWIEDLLQSEHIKWNKEMREMINTNQKGTFTDEVGNDCWYIDDLNKAFDQLDTLQVKKEV